MTPVEPTLDHKLSANALAGAMIATTATAAMRRIDWPSERREGRWANLMIPNETKVSDVEDVDLGQQKLRCLIPA